MKARSLASLAAGVDPAKATGWIFAKVPVMDSAGKSAEVQNQAKSRDLPSTREVSAADSTPRPYLLHSH